MKRLPNWPSLLAVYVESRRHLPFAWGSNDCVTFAAGAVEVMTGWRPTLSTWSGPLEAARTLAEHGGIEAAVNGIGAFTPLDNLWQARRGDLLLTTQEHGPALAVCLGHCWAAPGQHQLSFGNLSDATVAWKVG